jgi:hypothetical protein
MMLFARFTSIAHNVVYTVTTTIMHFKSFILGTMDSTTGGFGLEDVSVNQPPTRPPKRRGFKHVVTCEERYGKHSGHPASSQGVNDGDRSASCEYPLFVTELLLVCNKMHVRFDGVSYAALQAHKIVNVALHREYSLGIVFIFSQGRKYLYHV